MHTLLEFLQVLELNNNRPWFLEHQEEYQKVRKDILGLAERLIKSVSKFYDLPYDLRPNECIFRINRDTRFSKDKTPYKTNFGIEISQNGKRHGLPCFYLHIQPGNHSFLAGGLYMPDSQVANFIRQGIDQNGEKLKEIIAKIMRGKEFEMYDEALKTAPRGYKKDHPFIELLKLKHWIFEKSLSDKELLSEGFEKDVVKSFEKLAPFVEWLSEKGK